MDIQKHLKGSIDCGILDVRSRRFEICLTHVKTSQPNAVSRFPVAAFSIYFYGNTVSNLSGMTQSKHSSDLTYVEHHRQSPL